MAFCKSGSPRVRRKRVSTFQKLRERLPNLRNRYKYDGCPDFCLRATGIVREFWRIGTVDRPLRYLSVLSLRRGKALLTDKLSIILRQLFVCLLKLLQALIERNMVVRRGSFFPEFVWRQPGLL
ncbi:MAG: hypothetical protein C6Y20_09950 [Tagaea sp. CACIAM 22H2]|nr:hypothetical protein [Tagaea sp. CACIAM 22H2]